MPFDSFQNPIGLDISDLKLRFFQFENKGKKKIKIHSFGEIPVAPGLIVDGDIKNETEVLQLLKKLLSKPVYGRVSGKNINASILEKKTYIKVISVPIVPEEEMAGTVTWGIEQSIPVAIDQSYFDWHKIPSDKGTMNKQQEVIVAVAPKITVDSYQRLIEKNDYFLIGLENESTALSRCLIDQNANVHDPLLILDLGKSHTNIIIYAKNTVQFSTTIDINGEQMTEKIAANLRLSHEDAEKAKIICGLDKNKGHGAICTILKPMVERLIGSISENLEYYSQYIVPGEKINTIIITGSVSQMVGLPGALRDSLKCNVIIGDPWSNTPLPKDDKKLASQDQFFSYTTAIGLALKNFTAI